MRYDDHEPAAGDAAYPSDPTTRPGVSQPLECQVCGAVFEIVSLPNDGEEIVDAAGFLRRHGRCVRRTLNHGGSLAKPLPPTRSRRQR